MKTKSQTSLQLVSLAMEGFTSRFAQLVTHTGLNQSEFARRVGVSPGFISDLVRGLKKPGAEFLFAVRRTFGISIDWLLSGEGTLRGSAQIDLELLRTIRLQIAIARAAVLSDNSTARALLLLVRDGRLREAANDSTLRAFLDSVAPDEGESDLAAELYNGHLHAADPDSQRRNLLAAAVAYFESRRPIDKFAALSRPSPTVQINIGASQRVAGRDHHSPSLVPRKK